jgi:hypothetical protein
MGALPEVKVLPPVDHSERSEAQLHEGDPVWEGSVERKRAPMNKNWIQGAEEQGEAHIRRSKPPVRLCNRASAWGGC